jgi:carbonic anhydrase/acetyltransferase-like protein (isoleucine patch superfamily)
MQASVRIGEQVYIAPTAYVGGAVTIGDESTIMHQVCIRGDVGAITIGCRVNVQDGSILHTKTGVPLDIADEVAIGHRAVVHGRRVETGALIGIGAIVLDECCVGAGAIIAAGALLPPGTHVPNGKLAVGVPARILRAVSDEDRAYVARVVESYRTLGKLHAAGMYPNWTPDAR